MNFCTTCGSRLDEGAAFCANCGLAMKASVPRREAPETTPIPVFQQSENAPVSVEATTRLPQYEVKPVAWAQHGESSKIAKMDELARVITAPEPNSVDEQNAAQKTSDLFAVVTKSQENGNRPRVSPWAWASVVVVIVAVAGGAFLFHRSKQPSPQPAQLPMPAPSTAPLPNTATPAGLTVSSLANMSYQLGDALSGLGERTGTVKLVDGKGSFGDWNAFLDKEHVAFGDLNGDGIDDAAAVLTFEGPGSAAPQILVVVTNHSGKGESAAVKTLGDNAVVKSINISGGVITVNMLTVGPNDSMADPETPQTLTLKVQGSKFVPSDGYLAANGDAEFTSAQISSHGIQITPGSGFAFYPTFGGNWRITSPGGGFSASFNAPQDGNFELLVTHLTSAAPTCQGNGYSPITIALNSKPLVENYDPAQAHSGSHDFVTDRWTLNLHEGQNLLTWTAGNLCTQYWILRMEIQGDTPTTGSGT